MKYFNTLIKLNLIYIKKLKLIVLRKMFKI